MAGHDSISGAATDRVTEPEFPMYTSLGKQMPAGGVNQSDSCQALPRPDGPRWPHPHAPWLLPLRPGDRGFNSRGGRFFQMNGQRKQSSADFKKKIFPLGLKWRADKIPPPPPQPPQTEHGQIRATLAVLKAANDTLSGGWGFTARYRSGADTD